MRRVYLRSVVYRWGWWYVVILYIFAKCFVTMVVCIVVRLVFMSCSVMVSGFVPMFVVYLVLLNVVCFLRLCMCCM